MAATPAIADGAPGTDEDPRIALPDGDGALSGLCKSLEQDPSIRTRALANGKLLQWDNSKVVGVVNFTSIAKNYRVVEKVLSLWLPQTNVPKTINIEDAREQVRFG